MENMLNQKLCYIRETLSSYGGVTELPAPTRIGNTWEKCPGLSEALTMKGTLSLKQLGNVNL